MAWGHSAENSDPGAYPFFPHCSGTQSAGDPAGRPRLGARDDLLSSPKTIANQKTSIFHKLGLKNLQELQHIFLNY